MKIQINEKACIDIDELSKFIEEIKMSTSGWIGLPVINQPKIDFVYERSPYDGLRCKSVGTGFYTLIYHKTVFCFDVPAWTVAYFGGMFEQFWGNEELTQNAYEFRTEALHQKVENRYVFPFLGPDVYEKGDWIYKCGYSDDITRFLGGEHIFYKHETVLKLYCHGGLIVHQF